MLERREHARFSLEPRHPLGIGSKVIRQDLDGDLSAEPRVFGTVDLSPAAGTEFGSDLEVRPCTADQSRRILSRGFLGHPRQHLSSQEAQVVAPVAVILQYLRTQLAQLIFRKVFANSRIVFPKPLDCEHTGLV